MHDPSGGIAIWNELWQVLASRIYNWLLDFNKLNIPVNHFYFVGVQGLHLVLHKYWHIIIPYHITCVRCVR